MRAYTVGSAFAEFQENEKGSITPGKLADMVLLSDDIFKIDPVKIRDVKVEKTIVGGKIVWDASAGAPLKSAVAECLDHTAAFTSASTRGAAAV